jgi:hypothetical protein
MITCTPHSPLAWSFELEGDGLFASLDFVRLRERGWIQVEEQRLEVEKGGFLSGRWRLLHDDEAVAEATKRSAFTRDFELTTPAGELRLVAEQPYARRFSLRSGERVLAKLGPKTERSRVATIRTGRDVQPGELDSRLLCFAFWLVLMTWRRRRERGK